MDIWSIDNVLSEAGRKTVSHSLLFRWTQVALAAGRGPRIFSYYSRTSKWPGFGKDPEWLGCDLSQTSTFFCRQIHYCTLFQLIPKTTLWDRWALELSLHFTDESQGRYLTCLDHISKWRARLNLGLRSKPQALSKSLCPSSEQCSSDCGTHGSADSLVSPKGDALYLSNTHPIPFQLPWPVWHGFLTTQQSVLIHWEML